MNESEQTESENSIGDRQLDGDQEAVLNVTEKDISVLVNQVLKGDWENVSVPLSDWQISELEGLSRSESGIGCLLHAWFISQKDLPEGTYCNATWDNVYCWPPTPIGTTVKRTCEQSFQETQPLYASHLPGHGYRVCLPNATWLWGGWTNYTECADAFDALVEQTEDESTLVTTVQYILFIGSILSLVCLTTAVIIFYYFKCLWCDRVTIHIHLMMAHILRYLLLFIITEPFIFKRATNYRSVDGVCKAVLLVYLYATVTSTNWMFIQGIYINAKLTTNVFNGRTPFKIYYTIGWLLPAGLLGIYMISMNLHHHQVHCWSGYAQMNEIWIIIAPIVFALVINFCFLINILRILLTKVHTPGGPASDAVQFRRAAKATIFLFPLLGINNLLFVYNPGGGLHKYYVILNTLFGSTQGIFVSVVYCYLSKDVRAAFRRVYRRFVARRNANLIRRRTNPRISRRSTGYSTSCTGGLIIEQPVNSHHRRNPTSAGLRNVPQRPSLTINCNSTCNSNNNHSRRQSQEVSTSPSQNTLCREILNNPSGSPSHSTSSVSHTSAHRVYGNGCSSSASACAAAAVLPSVHTFRNGSPPSCLLSPENHWSSAADTLGSRTVTVCGRKNQFCVVSIPMDELN